MRLIPLILFCLAASAAACDTVPIPSAPSVAPSNTPSPAPGGRSSNGPTLGPANPLEIGATVRSRVELDDPNCFYNWDATGRCQFFKVTPSRDGELTAVLLWSTPSGRAVGLMDLFIVDPNGNWTWSNDSVAEKRGLIQAVKAGRSYVIIAMAYGQADFELTTLM